ncbi:MAG: YwqJ-related putative deaminase [Spirulinaceae cyanobacterium]
MALPLVGGRALKWLGKTKAGKLAGEGFQALGKSKVGKLTGEGLEWAGKQGSKGVDWAAKQRENVIEWGGKAVKGAGERGKEMLRPVDELLTGRNMEMVGVPGGGKPRASTPKPAPHAPRPNASKPTNAGKVKPEGTDEIANAEKVADDPEAVKTLTDTAPKQRLDDLSSKELDTELELAGDLPRKQINEPPYIEEVELPNGHEWKRQEDGTWCRFSEPKGDNCLYSDAKELVDTVNKDAQEVIAGTGKNQRRKMAATSRAGSSESGTITQHFENIKPTQPTHEFPGFEVTDKLDDGFVITVKSPDKFMEELTIIYDRQGTTLHPKLEEKIRNLVSGKGRTFSSRDGVPGLHAEVLAVNAELHKLTEKGEEITEEVLKKIDVATYRVTPNPKNLEGKPFPACPNCTKILQDNNILTGVTEK